MEHAVELFAAGRRHCVTLGDLSRTGMFLHLSPPLEVGARVLVALDCDGRRHVTAACVTHRLDEAEAAALGRRAGIGIELCEPTDASDQLFAIAIDRLVRARRAALAAPGHHRVVFADSQPALRERMAAALREAGFDVEEVADGAALLDACARRRPDVVIAEGALPELDGFRVAARLAGDPRLAGVPVIVTSPDPADLDGAFERGAADFLVRPFAAFEVIARARRLARGGGGAARTAILRGDLAGFALPALLTLLAQERQSGRLELTAHLTSGTAWIELADGLVVGAGTSEHAGGEPAALVMSLLDWTRGTFELVARPPARAAAHDPHAMSVTHLLLEHARRRDEATRPPRVRRPD